MHDYREHPRSRGAMGEQAAATGRFAFGRPVGDSGLSVATYKQYRSIFSRLPAVSKMGGAHGTSRCIVGAAHLVMLLRRAGARATLFLVT